MIYVRWSTGCSRNLKQQLQVLAGASVFTLSTLLTLIYVDSVTDLVISGPLVLAAGVAMVAGVITFASPCVVPLVPGYLAYLAALVGADAPAVHEQEERKAGRFAVVGATALFVLGFTVVLSAGLGGLVWLADLFDVNRDLLQRIGGGLIILMGLVFLGVIPWLQRDFRVHRVPRGGVWTAPALGAVFGLGWTPCLGPTLSGVAIMSSATGGTAVRGFFLILLYCLGLGIPFLLIALGTRWAVRGAGWLRRHGRRVQFIGGGLLIVVGLLLMSGLWAELTGWLRNTVVSDMELPL